MQAVERLGVFEFPECPKKGSGLLTVSATVSVNCLSSGVAWRQRECMEFSLAEF